MAAVRVAGVLGGSAGLLSAGWAAAVAAERTIPSAKGDAKNRAFASFERPTATRNRDEIRMGRFFFPRCGAVPRSLERPRGQGPSLMPGGCGQAGPPGCGHMTVFRAAHSAFLAAAAIDPRPVRPPAFEKVSVTVEEPS